MSQRILVVDDEEGMCWALARALGELRCEITTVGSAAAALARAREERFDLALVDAKLPDGDGLDLAARLAALAEGLPVILVSGYYYPGDEEVAAATSSGVIKGFLGKPFDHGELRSLAKRHLGLD